MLIFWAAKGPKYAQNGQFPTSSLRQMFGISVLYFGQIRGLDSLNCLLVSDLTFYDEKITNTAQKLSTVNLNPTL